MAEVIEKFSYREFVDYAVNREKHRVCGYESSKRGTTNFTQTKSFEQAIDYANNGWDLGLEQFKIEDGVLSSGTTHLNPSLAGSMPHVQNFINGFPQQMFELVDEREYNLPTLDLIVPLNYASGVDSKNALKFGKSIVAYINKMASTHNIRLTGVFCLSWGGKRRTQVVTLKNFDEALVINNIAFAFHPSFFRRVWFSVMESREYWYSGYGSNIYKDYREYVSQLFEDVNSDKRIYFKSLMDMKRFEFTQENASEFVL